MKKALLYDKNDYFLFYPNASCTSIFNASDLWPRMLEFVTKGLIHVAVNIPEDFLMNNEGQNLLLQHLVIWKLCILFAQVDGCAATILERPVLEVLEHQSDWPGHGQVLAGYLHHCHALSFENRGRPQLRPLLPGQGKLDTFQNGTRIISELSWTCSTFVLVKIHNFLFPPV